MGAERTREAWSGSFEAVAPAVPCAVHLPRFVLSLLLVVAPAGLATSTVRRVSDGDTVRIVFEGQNVRVRLIGIDTPEVGDDRPVVRCLADAATRRTTTLALGREVRVELDPSQGRYDKYGRLLAYLWLPDRTMLNERLVAEGYAFEYTYRRPYKYRSRFRAAQQQARQQRLGLWGAAPACKAAA